MKSLNDYITEEQINEGIFSLFGIGNDEWTAIKEYNTMQSELYKFLSEKLTKEVCDDKEALKELLDKDLKDKCSELYNNCSSTMKSMYKLDSLYKDIINKLTKEFLNK